jgi:hypothetical protein
MQLPLKTFKYCADELLVPNVYRSTLQLRSIQGYEHITYIHVLRIIRAVKCSAVFPVSWDTM